MGTTRARDLLTSSFFLSRYLVYKKAEVRRRNIKIRKVIQRVSTTKQKQKLGGGTQPADEEVTAAIILHSTVRGVQNSLLQRARVQAASRAAPRNGSAANSLLPKRAHLCP